MSGQILVVEDNALNRELLCDWLETEGFTAVTAETLAEALAIFEEQTPQAVLLDVQLGTEDGLALATWVRNNPRLRSLPVIAVTAHAMVTDQQRVMQAGCNACVSKPVDFKLLSQHLQACLLNAP
ncbi:MAG TPA: response regulator [Terracidiphilus sp.]|nr:response regulator [Terracidiphilus sp.]